VEGVLAQRLVRVLCPHCKQPYAPTPEDVPSDFPLEAAPQIYRPGGCRLCHNTGYSGRKGIFELLKTDAGIRDLCVRRASAGEIKKYALEHNLTTLRMDGWNKVLQGITSVDEVVKITKGDLR
jgi:general secretion pathway protein E/type IV pilus assembly protein PilB